MADTAVSGAVVFPQDEGLPNVSDGSESWDSAGLLMGLAQCVESGSYARSESELAFTGHDGANDQVDVTAGVAYLDLAGETVNVQSTQGGTNAPAYDTALPSSSLPCIMVVLPSNVTNLDVQASTLSDVWLAYATDDSLSGSGITAGDVYLRSDDTGAVSAPSHPNVKLGQANPDSAGADVLANRFPTPSSYGVVPPDMITIWSGAIADIPTGWVICDGNNGTPNLQDKFVVGAGNTYSVGGTGGESTHALTESELASHDHTLLTGSNDGTDRAKGGDSTGSGSANTETTGSGSAHENKPPYHALAFVMRT